ncbi:MAG: NMD3-related protein [Candidatus Woesearchaeota archaeon]
MKPSNYYEGILQLRDVSQELLDYCEENIPEELVAYVKKAKNGYDFYMQSNKFLSSFAKTLQKEFAGEMKKTATLHTRDTKNNKDLYRLTVLFREYDIRKGDEIEVKGTVYEVLGIHKKLYLKDTHTKKKVHMPFDDYRKQKGHLVRR